MDEQNNLLCYLKWGEYACVLERNGRLWEIERTREKQSLSPHTYTHIQTHTWWWKWWCVGFLYTQYAPLWCNTVKYFTFRSIKKISVKLIYWPHLAQNTFNTTYMCITFCVCLWIIECRIYEKIHAFNHSVQLPNRFKLFERWGFFFVVAVVHGLLSFSFGLNRSVFRKIHIFNFAQQMNGKIGRKKNQFHCLAL